MKKLTKVRVKKLKSPMTNEHEYYCLAIDILCNQ